MRVITFSRFFPSYHPRKGESTFFVEKILNGIAEKTPGNGLVDRDKLSREVLDIVNDFVFLCSKEDIKSHTIRAGNRWKVGDKFSPRVWGDDINPKSGRKGAYQSKQIEIAPPIEINKIWDIRITTEDDDGEHDWSFINLNNKHYTVYSDEYLSTVIKSLAANDGLSTTDFFELFKLERTSKQRLNNEPKIFTGQVICWNDNIDY